MRLSTSLGLTLGALAAANVVAHRVAPRAGVPIGGAVVVGLGLIIRSAGLTPAELGLDPRTWRSGLRWGAGSAGLVAAGYGAALTIPAVRRAVPPSGGSRSRAVLRAAVTIPLTTVVPEEFAFRGVLLGLLVRHPATVGSGRCAAIASSILFGLWHLLPAMGSGPANETVIGVVGTGPRGIAIRVTGTALVTAVSGLLMCQVRLRSGSLLAPALAHWAVNGIGELVASVQ